MERLGSRLIQSALFDSPSDELNIVRTKGQQAKTQRKQSSRYQLGYMHRAQFIWFRFVPTTRGWNLRENLGDSDNSR